VGNILTEMLSNLWKEFLRGSAAGKDTGENREHRADTRL